MGDTIEQGKKITRKWLLRGHWVWCLRRNTGAHGAFLGAVCVCVCQLSYLFDVGVST